VTDQPTTAPADLRNDLARARDDWMLSDEGTRMADGSARGKYLRNRLEAAFIAGWNACEAREFDKFCIPVYAPDDLPHPPKDAGPVVRCALDTDGKSWSVEVRHGSQLLLIDIDENDSGVAQWNGEKFVALHPSDTSADVRLFDSQWVNIVNAKGQTIEDAVKATEAAMRENITKGWPKPRADTSADRRDAIFDLTPQLASVDCGPEPSLRRMVFAYYAGSGMDRVTAENYTEEYIAAIARDAQNTRSDK
jgi:hypothetical protein